MQKYYTDTMDEKDVARIPSIQSITELENFCLKNYGEDLAIWGFDYKFTYKTFFEEVAAIRGWLLGKGVKEGDKVGVCFRNGYELVALFFAASTIKAVAVLIPAGLPSERIIPCAKMTDCKLLLTGVDGVASEGFVYSYQDIDKSQKAEALTIENPKIPAGVIFTGGTTSFPKAALLSHKNLCTTMIYGIMGTKNCFGASYVTILPLTHVFGLVRSCLTAFVTGSSNYMVAENKNMFRDFAIAKPTILILVPGLVELIYGLMMARGAAIVGGRLDTIIAGGAMVSPALVAKITSLGISIFPGYGLTESANLVSGNAHPMQKPNSVGLPYEGQEVKLVEGEIWLKGDNVFLGYYNNPEENAKSFTEDGWFKTGDLGRIDGDGELEIVGRIKNIIVLPSGENISTEELEWLLGKQEIVKECLVYEEKINNIPCIMAEVFPTKPNLSAEELALELEKARLAVNAQMPAGLGIAVIKARDAEFPKSPSMKIIRPKKQ